MSRASFRGSALPLAESRHRLGGLRRSIVAVSNPRIATVSGPEFIPIALQQDGFQTIGALRPELGGHIQSQNIKDLMFSSRI